MTIADAVARAGTLLVASGEGHAMLLRVHMGMAAGSIAVAVREVMRVLRT